MKKTLVLATVATVAVGSTAAADILWDQSDFNPDPTSAASRNQQFPDFASFSTYQMGDATFGGNVTINSITIYTTNLNNGSWLANITSAVVNVFAKTGSLPGGGDDPTSGAVVGVTVADLGAGTLAVTASGLSINAGAGDHWVGLTPIGAFVGVGQEFQRTTLSGVQGDESVVRNPGGGFGLGGDWIGISGLPGGAPGDGAMLIEGVPAPGALALLGLAGFAARRRRRA